MEIINFVKKCCFGKKVLVVEDCPTQIEWAKKELKKYKLTFASTKEEAEKKLLKTWDMVITDLFLPEKTGEQERAVNGLAVFSLTLELQNQGRIKGVGLVSNWDGHTEESREKKEEADAARVAVGLRYTAGKNTRYAYIYGYGRKFTEKRDAWIQRQKNGKKNVNLKDKYLPLLRGCNGKLFIDSSEAVKKDVIVVAGTVGLNEWPVYHFGGQILPNQGSDFNYYDLLKKGGKILKPFRKVAEYLETFCH